jgi:hypothetical protein
MQDLILVTWIYMEMVRQGLIHGGGKGASPSEKEQNRPLPQEQMDDDSMMADDADTDGVYVYDSG